MSGFYVEHFGCRAARADGEAVSHHLLRAGMSESAPAVADVVVVNTCSVTAEADREALAFIRRTHRQNPHARIVVTGCYAQRAPEEIAALEGVSSVVGNSHKALAPEIVLGLIGRPSRKTESLVSVQSLMNPNSAGAQVWVDDSFAHSFLEEAQVAPGAQTRPNLKIQEGCSNRCTFCVIPYTRGASRSLDEDAILRQMQGFVAANGKELVISGINLGRWGKDLAPRTSLAALVRRIFAETKLPWLRLSSIEPMDWDADLIALMAEFGGTRLARHAHLPLQSGSDGVLRRMHRRYRPWHYAEKVEALEKAAGSHLTLGADVMVGFPGETDEEFEETVSLIRTLPFGYLHLFPFSPRPGTPGWTLHAERPVPAHVVQTRITELRALAAEKSAAHRRDFVGRTVDAITLHTPDGATSDGVEASVAITENFLPMKLHGHWEPNQLVRARVSGLNSDGELDAVCV